MLVVTRKIGQQIVLPGCNVTIDVVGATKSHVRLGIEAPSEVAVYRRELLDRIQLRREIPTGGEAELNDHVVALADEPGKPITAGASPRDLDRCLAEWVARRAGGRIRQLSVKTVGDRTVIHGWATTYYARQLAQAAVNEVLNHWPSRPLPNVECEIDVVDRTFVSRAGNGLSFSSHFSNCQTG